MQPAPGTGASHVNRTSEETDTTAMAVGNSSRMANIIGFGPAELGWCNRALRWMVDARSHRVICCLMGIWLLNGFDLVFAILSHEQGLLHEENPLAAHMLRQGMGSIILYKIGLVLIGSYPLLRFRTARIAELGTFVVLVAYALLAMRWSACFELYVLSSSHTVSIAEVQSIGGGSP